MALLQDLTKQVVAPNIFVNLFCHRRSKSLKKSKMVCQRCQELKIQIFPTFTTKYDQYDKYY